MFNGFDYPQFFSYFFESCNGFIEMFLCMRGRKLNADARLTFWYNREKESDHINSFLQKLIRKILR